MWNHTGNILLHKDDVGKSKPTVYKLPGEGFSYGAYNRQPEKGVKEGSLLSPVIHEWQYSQLAGNNENIRNIIRDSNQKGYVRSPYSRFKRVKTGKRRENLKLSSNCLKRNFSMECLTAHQLQ